MGDLLARLAVPPERVWFIPLPGTATEDDVVYADERLNRLVELVDGTLVEKPMGSRESRIAAIIVYLLNAFVLPRKLGSVFGPDGMFRLFSGRVRLPDVAYASFERLPEGSADTAVITAAPELAVEVLSPGNTVAEMKFKRQEYFTSGVRLVWLVDPETRSVAVYTGPDAFTTRASEELLDGGDVLPGFSVLVRDLFPGAASTTRQ